MTKKSRNIFRGRVAILSPFPTAFAGQGSNNRVFSLCRELREKGYSISILLYLTIRDCTDLYSATVFQDMRKEWDEVELIIPSGAEKDGGDNRECWDHSIGNHLKWFFRTRKVEAFIVTDSSLSKALEFAPENCFKILDMFDSYSDLELMTSMMKEGDEGLHNTFQKLEPCLSKADLAIVQNEDQRNHLHNNFGISSTHISFFERKKKPRRRKKAHETLNFGIIGAQNESAYNDISASLSVASQKIGEAHLSKVKQSMNELSSKIENRRHNTLFFLDSNVLKEGLVSESHIISTILTVSKFQQPIVFIEGPADKYSPNFLKSLSRLALIYSDNNSFENLYLPEKVNCETSPQHLIDLFKISTMWIFGDRGLEVAHETRLRVFSFARYLTDVPIEKVTKSYSVQNRSKLYFGRPTKKLNKITMSDVEQFDVAPISVHAINKLKVKIRKPDIDHVGIIISKSLSHWLLPVANLARQSAYEYRILCRKTDFKFMWDEISDDRMLRFILPFEDYFDKNTPEGRLVFKKIVNVSDISLALDFELLKSLTESIFGKTPCWDFPKTSLYKPLDILPDIYDYLSNKGRWDFQKNALPRLDDANVSVGNKLRSLST